jgi:dipeptidyl aminopeptidase/acylaminoacyl peptidase
MRSAKQYTSAQFMNTARISGVAFSPDEEKILYTSDASGIRNVYEVCLSDGRHRQLTYSRSENIQSISYLPNDGCILFSKDLGNLENSILCVLEPTGKEIVITPGAEVQTLVHGWSLDQLSFFASTNERDQRLYDLYKFDALTFKRRLIYKATEKFYFCSISPDEKYILFAKSDRKADSDIFLYDVSREEMKCLTAHDGDVLNCLAVFNGDATAVYYITNEGSDFRYVKRLDLASGESTCVEKASGDVAWTFFSPDGRRRISFCDDPYTTLRSMKVHDEETGSVFTLSGFDDRSLNCAVVSRSGRHVGFYAEGDRSPGNLFVHDFKTRFTTQLTESLNRDVDRQDLVESQIVSFHSFDGLEIPCLLWRPHGTSETGRAPALVWVHGGPGGRLTKGYKGRIQYFVNHGYVVLGVNYRGSYGFGKTFYNADHRKQGREPLWDCVAAKNYLASLGYVDTARIVIIGASFGGYMALAAATFCENEFAAAVDICGPSNLVSLVKKLPKYWDKKRFYDKIGDPQKDEELLRSISPLFHADKIKRPVMILQGANDPRCPREQSDEMVAAIRRHGGPVEYLVYDDEAHGFRKRKNAIHAYEAILNFLDANLKSNVIQVQSNPMEATVSA